MALTSTGRAPYLFVIRSTSRYLKDDRSKSESARCGRCIQFQGPRVCRPCRSPIHPTKGSNPSVMRRKRASGGIWKLSDFQARIARSQLEECNYLRGLNLLPPVVPSWANAQFHDSGKSKVFPQSKELRSEKRLLDGQEKSYLSEANMVIINYGIRRIRKRSSSTLSSLIICEVIWKRVDRAW